jgi:hypothetical protein
LVIKKEVFVMKKYFVFFMLLFSILFVQSAKGKQTVLSSTRWEDDVRIGDKDSVNAVAFDVDYSTGNLFVALQNTESGIDFCTVYMSSDTGKTWLETGFIGPGIGAIAAAVHDNGYFYVVYSIDDDIFSRRFSTSNGIYDAVAGTDTITMYVGYIEEIALISANDYYSSSYQRLYCLAIASDSVLRYYSSTTGLGWGSSAVPAYNADRGLDAYGNEGYSSELIWWSYIGTNDSVYIGSHAYDGFSSYGPLTDVAWSIHGFSSTSIGAYGDTVMVLYPYVFSEFGCAVNSCVSYDGGSNWEYEGTVFASSLTMGAGDITARKGDGFGVAIPDYNFGLYTHRDYPPGDWSDTVHFTDAGTSYRIKPSIERIATNSYGIVYVDRPTMGAFFDISQWPEPPGIEEKSQEQILLNVTLSLFSSQTSIEYILPTSQNISLDIYDILGNHIINLVSGSIQAGSHSTVWDGKDALGSPVASGMYFCVLKSNNKSTASKKITLIK